MPRIPTVVAAVLAAVFLATPGAAGAALPAIAGQAWILVDDTTGSMMASSNPDRALPPASLTKMVTAQVVAERAKLDDFITISESVSNAEADRVKWPLGMRFTVEDVLHGLLMESSNGAAIALAQHVAGSVRAFAIMMNEKARALGATSSTFVNPHGLDAPSQLATPRDLAKIARGLLRVPRLREIVRTDNYKLTWHGGLATFHNNTRFLSQYPGAIGVKPGYTTRAGNCLAAAAERGGKTLIAVVMNSTSVTEDASKLMDQGFAQLGVAPYDPAARDEGVDGPAPVFDASVTDPSPAPLASPAAEITPSVRVADSRMPSPAGTLLVFAVSGLVTVRRRKAAMTGSSPTTPSRRARAAARGAPRAAGATGRASSRSAHGTGSARTRARRRGSRREPARSSPLRRS